MHSETGTDFWAKSKWGPQGMRSKLWSMFQAYHGGVQRTKFWAMGPTGLAGKPPPSGGGGSGVCCAGDSAALQLGLGQSGALYKNLKNKRTMEP